MSVFLAGSLVFLVVCFFAAILIAGLRLTPMFGRDAARFEALLSDEPITSRYRPMERLLRESEWDYLAGQPGFDAARIRIVKAQRRRVFREYLRCMSADFASVCYLVRVLMVQSPVARPDLAHALGRLRLQYALALIKIEVRLFVHAAGVTSVSFDVSGLIRSLEQLGTQVRSLQVISAQPRFA